MLPKKLPSAETRLEVSRIIAQASGAFCMIGGQILDMENENREVDVSLIEDTQRQKQVPSYPLHVSAAVFWQRHHWTKSCCCQIR